MKESWDWAIIQDYDIGKNLELGHNLGLEHKKYGKLFCTQAVCPQKSVLSVMSAAGTHRMFQIEFGTVCMPNSRLSCITEVGLGQVANPRSDQVYIQI